MPPVHDAGRRILPDLLIPLGYLAAGGWVLARQWVDPVHRAARANQADQALMEWMLAHAAHAVTHLENPLYTHLVNAPDGANLMVNSSVILPGLLLTPITLLFGAAWSYALLSTLALAGTAAGWYLVFRRRLVPSRAAAAIGAGLIGFAPGMLSLANGHVHITAQFLVPWIALCALPARATAGPPTARRPRPVRRAIALGVLLTAQVLTGTEVLMFTVLGIAVFVLGWAALHRAEARALRKPFLIQIGIGAAVGLALSAYPLWVLLFGAGSYHGTPWDIHRFATDVASYPWLGPFTLIGDDHRPLYAANRTEEVTFLGPGLLLGTLAVIWWLRRNRTVLALALTALVFALLSLGTEVVVLGHWTGVPGPWAALGRLPLFEQAIPDRLALITIAAIGALVAIGVDRAIRLRRRRPWLIAALAVALVPILPLPLPVSGRPAAPAFFAEGFWRQCVRPGGTLVPVPLAAPADRTGVRWAAAADAAFALPAGPVMLPDAHGHARWSAPLRPTLALLRRVATTGTVPELTDDLRRQAREDLRAYRTECLVLAPSRYQDEVRRTVTDLLGTPPERIADVWAWRVAA